MKFLCVCVLGGAEEPQATSSLFSVVHYLQAFVIIIPSSLSIFSAVTKSCVDFAETMSSESEAAFFTSGQSQSLLPSLGFLSCFFMRP